MTRRRNTRWLAFAWACFLACAIAVTAGVVRGVVACDAVLVEVAEPKGWRAWPEVAELGGYVVEGHMGSDKNAPWLEDAMLAGGGLCPGGGVSLGSWFRYLNQDAWEGGIRLHHQGGGEVSVVSGVGFWSKEETFISAFRRATGSRLVFSGPEPLVFVLVTLGMLTSLGFGLVSAHGRLRQARSFADPAVYKEGVRDDSGIITFEDGTSPVPQIDVLPFPPGAVLVRPAGTSPESYRRMSTTRSRDIVEGSRAELVAAEERAAVAAFRRALLACMLIGGLAVGAVACAIVSGMSP